MNSADGEVLGSTTPRIFTPPLIKGPAGPCGCGCALTPETSYGFDVIDFADNILQLPLDPWERWLVIHAGELLPDGRPRFRKLLVLVARQNGKTHVLKILSLYWMFVERWPLILGTSTTRNYALEPWQGAIEIAEDNEWLAPEIAPNGIRHANGSQQFKTIYGCKYRVAASNKNAGRSLSIDRLILDEIRAHQDFTTWNAATYACNARPYAQIFAISNQGDETAIVLDSLRTPALHFIETGQGDPRLGLMEWSAPTGSDPTDIHALAMSNPNLGYRMDAEVLLGEALKAKANGGEDLASFLTEVMCQRVTVLDPAIDPFAWKRCGTHEPLDLSGYRKKLALCLDISLDGSHISLLAAAVIDDKVHVEVIEQWQGFGCTKQMRAELPDIVARIRPAMFCWFPNGPTAAVATQLKERKTNRAWPPRGVKLHEITGDTIAVCMGLSEQVGVEDIVHPRDAMLTAHVEAAQKLRRGEAWSFTRVGTGPIDGAYALAGAVHCARIIDERPDFEVI